MKPIADNEKSQEASGRENEAEVTHGETAQISGEHRRIRISLERIKPMQLNCNQVDDESFDELVSDIKANGLRYPILVRQVGSDVYRAIDGEHRLKAIRQLGMKEIDAEVLDVTEEQAEVMNYRINATRGTTNPMKVALRFKMEMDRGLSQRDIAKKYGLTQPRVNQYLEILTYSKLVQDLLISRLITPEHARIIKGKLDDLEFQDLVAQMAADRHLSVRETEKIIDGILNERRRKDEWRRQRGELLGALDFLTICGAGKSDRCRYRCKDYCREWSWSDEPVELRERLPWLDFINIKGRWYAKISRIVCALCNSFAQKGDEMDGMRAKMKELNNGLWWVRDQIHGPLSSLSSACKANGEWKRGNCAFYRGGYCGNWHWESKPNLTYLIGEPVLGSDVKWRICPTFEYCAFCPSYTVRK